MNPRALRKASASAAVRPDRLGKVRSRKFPTLGVTSIPSSAIASASQGSQRALCAIAAFDMRGVVETRDARGQRRARSD